MNESDHISGRPSASITLVEYGDYQCPDCGAAHQVIKKILKDFGSDLLFVFRNFPLQEVHPAAMIAAQAAEASALQRKFWEMHDLIFEHQDELDEDNLLYFAETLDLNLTRFSNDMTSHVVIFKIENDVEKGKRSAVEATPTFSVNDKKVESFDGTYKSLADAIMQAE